MLVVDRKYYSTAEYIKYLCLVDHENVIRQMDYIIIKKMMYNYLYYHLYTLIYLYYHQYLYLLHLFIPLLSLSLSVTLYEHMKVVACCKKVSPHNQNW